MGKGKMGTKAGQNPLPPQPLLQQRQIALLYLIQQHPLLLPISIMMELIRMGITMKPKTNKMARKVHQHSNHKSITLIVQHHPNNKPPTQSNQPKTKQHSNFKRKRLQRSADKPMPNGAMRKWLKLTPWANSS